VFFKRSTDNEAHFKSTINLSNDEHDSRTPQIAAVGNNVYVAWIDHFSPFEDENQVFFKRSTNEGASFGDVKNIRAPGSDENILNLHIAATGNNVYVAWIGGGEETMVTVHS
jgi:hypothetical protein